MSATAIVGGQWGSEGKGVVAAAIARHFDAAVRTGGPNAGHSFYAEGRERKLYKMRGVPCAWVNPECELFIGAAAVVDPGLLAREMDDLPKRVTLTIDSQATVVTHDAAQAEADAKMWERIGSTTEGVGVTRMRKIARDGSAVLARDIEWPDRVRVVEDVSARLWEIGIRGGRIMLEGTQGSGLSMHHGEYPYVTSADTNAAQLAADAGVAPSLVKHTYLVVRTLPIRVAGNSGPMGGEIEWDLVMEHAGIDQPERTTVTNRIRRIAHWNQHLFEKAVRLNNPCGVFLMFADYLVPSMKGTTDARALLRASRPTPLGDLVLIRSRIQGAGVPIVGYGTGGQHWEVAFDSPCLHGERLS